MVYNNLPPSHLGVTIYTKNDDQITPEFKQQIYEAISHNRDSITLEGRNWKILPNSGRPRLG